MRLLISAKPLDKSPKQKKLNHFNKAKLRKARMDGNDLSQQDLKALDAFLDAGVDL